MLSLLRRDVRKNLLFYLLLMAEIFACIVVLALLAEPLVLAMREKLADDRRNYECYSDVLQGSFASEEEFLAYMNGLSFNGEKVVYGLYEDAFLSLDYPVTEKEKAEGMTSLGLIIDKTAAAHLKLNNVTGSWFSAEYPEGYSEILVNEEFRDRYKIGGIYEESELGRVKVIGYLRNGVNFSFIDTGRVSSSMSGYLMCAEVHPVLPAPDAGGESTARIPMLVFSPLDRGYLSTLPFVRGEIASPERYSGYDDVYGTHFNANRDAMFMVVVVDVIFMLSVATNTAINQRKNTKTNACYFLCGATERQIVLFELMKMAMVFLIPFVLILLIAPALAASAKFRYFMLAAGIIFLAYLIPQCGKIVSIFTANHLNVLRGVQ